MKSVPYTGAASASGAASVSFSVCAGAAPAVERHGRICCHTDKIRAEIRARESAEVIPEIDEEIANQIKEFSSI